MEYVVGGDVRTTTATRFAGGLGNALAARMACRGGAGGGGAAGDGEKRRFHHFPDDLSRPPGGFSRAAATMVYQPHEPAHGRAGSSIVTAATIAAGVSC